LGPALGRIVGRDEAFQRDENAHNRARNDEMKARGVQFKTDKPEEYSWEFRLRSPTQTGTSPQSTSFRANPPDGYKLVVFKRKQQDTISPNA
jgi:hypothetical protein